MSEPNTRANSQRILIVDDQPMIAEVLSHMLSSEGYIVETAESGADALAQFQQQPFDLVITDAAMPEMNGGELAQAVKGANPATRVMLLTGYGDSIVDQGDEYLRADLIVSKPVTRATMQEALARLFGESQQASGPQS